LNLKDILKSFKLNESTISMVLGALVIIIVSVLVVNYFKDRSGGTLPFLTKEGEEVSTTFQAKSYTVAKGDNLWTIAEKQYGSGYNWIDIAFENKLNNPNAITEGQVLTLPSVEVRKPVAVEKTETVSQAKAGQVVSGETYTVIKGDNLWNIAVRAYGDGFKWTEIAKANKLVNPDLIHPGNVFVLPR
jgi:nucleoid-associated protein YgaU